MCSLYFLTVCASRSCVLPGSLRTTPRQQSLSARHRARVTMLGTRAQALAPITLQRPDEADPAIAMVAAVHLNQTC